MAIPKNEWNDFFIGLFYALPISILIWVGIIFAVYKLFW